MKKYKRYFTYYILWSQGKNRGQSIRIYYFTILDNFICLDYMCLLQNKLSKNDKRFEKADFNGLPGIYISGILINLISCHGFA